MRIVLGVAAVSALAAALFVSTPATAGLGVHSTNGVGTAGGTVAVNALEPGIGSVVVNGTSYTVTCMQVSPSQATPGGTHDVFISAITVTADGTTQKVFIRIVDTPTGPDLLGYNFVGLTFGIACDADQNVVPVTSGGYTTLP